MTTIFALLTAMMNDYCLGKLLYDPLLAPRHGRWIQARAVIIAQMARERLMGGSDMITHDTMSDC